MEVTQSARYANGGIVVSLPPFEFKRRSLQRRENRYVADDILHHVQMSIGHGISRHLRREKHADWNKCADFVHFARGRFVSKEAERMAQRHIKFDMNQLCEIAGNAVGKKSVNVEKFADGMYNKAFLLTMPDDSQVVAKMPNPNAGLAHFTTASDVATTGMAA